MIDAPKNRMMVDYRDDTALRSTLGPLKPGEQCRLAVRGRVVANGEAGLELVVEDCEADGPDGGEKEQVEVGDGSPVMMVMRRQSETSKEQV